MDKNKETKKASSNRSLKYGTNAIIMVIFVIAIAVLLNFVVGLLDLKLDLTPNKLFSLSETTENVLKDLDQEVRIIGFFDDATVSPQDEIKKVTDVLALYDKNPNVTVEYVDPDKNPGFINKLDPNKTMDIAMYDFVVMSTVNGNEKKKKIDPNELFQMDEQSYQIIGLNAEQGFTGAIKYVTAEYTPVIYFTEGHDETGFDTQFTQLKGIIENNNFLVKSINLMTIDVIPEDAEAIIVTSPKKDITFGERDLLERYLLAGGNALFMFDYDENDPSFDEMNKLLSKVNIAVNYDKVKENDENRHLPDDQYTILATSPFSNNEVFLMKNSRSINILNNQKEYVKTTPVLTTSELAVGEMVNKSRGDDITGPLNLAVAVEYGGGTDDAKILVLGNSSFIRDDAYQAFGNLYEYNLNFILQWIGWMVDKQDETLVAAKTYDVNSFSITDLQSNVMSVVLIIVFPLIVFGTGLMVYLRRRHL